MGGKMLKKELVLNAYILAIAVFLVIAWELFIEGPAHALIFGSNGGLNHQELSETKTYYLFLFSALCIVIYFAINLMIKLSATRKSMFVLDQYERLIDTANAPSFGIDDRGYVNEWNQTAESLTGYG